MEEIQQRILNMPRERRAELLSRAGVCLEAAAEAGGTVAASPLPPPPERGWPFPSNLPSRERLAAYLQQQHHQEMEQQQQQLLRTSLQQQRGWGPGVAPALTPAGVAAAAATAQEAAAAAERRPLLLELLAASRTFQCPDAADAMADHFGVSDLHRSLRGSLVAPPQPEAHVAAARAALRGRLRAAWGEEALRRGVALAKSGDLSGALPCYDQALHIDPGCADALVARGAARANLERWQDAADDLEAALQLAPDHPNAAAYLEAVRAKALATGVRLLSPAARREAEQEQQQQRLQNGGATAHTQQQQQQQQRHGEAGEACASGDGAREAARATDGQRERGERRGRGRSRSRSRSRGGGSSSSDASSDSAAAAAARLAQASGVAAEGGAMDAATALDIVSRHYRSRKDRKEGRRKKEKRRNGEKRKRKERRKEKKRRR